jgi:hypothetical protein
MKHWTSPTYELSVRTKHSRVSLATRLLGLLILLLAVLFWPTAVLAADTGVETQRNAAVVFTLLLVTIVAIGAGVFFASPFGRRFLVGPAMPLAAGASAVSSAAARLPTASTLLAEPDQPIRLMATRIDPITTALPPTIAQLAPLPPIAPAPQVSVPAATGAPWLAAAKPEPTWPQIDLRGQPDLNIRAQAQAAIASTAPTAAPEPTRHFPSPWSTSEPSLTGNWNHDSRSPRR